MPGSNDYRLYLEEKFEGMQKVQHAYFKEVHDKLDAIQVQTTKSNCRITKIEDDLAEYRMIKKYPKIALTIIAIAVIAVILSFRSIINKQNGLKAQVDIINTPIKDTRSGKIYLYPSGLAIDSVINKGGEK